MIKLVIRQMLAKQKLEMTLVNYIHSQWTRCLQNFTQDGNMTLKLISVEVRNNKTRIFESMLMSFHQELRPECKNESLHTTRKQKEVDCFHVNEYCNHCKTVFEALGCYYHFCFCQKKPVHFCQKKILKGEIRSKKWMS